MKHPKLFVIILLAFSGIVLFANASLAAKNWYFDKDAIGANDGTSWTNAWSSFSSLVWGSGGVSAGDTLYISGGSASKTYTATSNYMFGIGASGTPGNPITITTGAKSPSPSGHDGKVIFDGNGLYGNLINSNYLSYVTIDGEKDGRIDWVIQNGKKDVRGDPGLMDLPDAKGVIIKYLELTGGANGLGIAAANPNCSTAERVEVAYCYIHDIRDDACIGATAGCSTSPAYDGILIHDNIINPNLYSFGDGSGPDGANATFGVSFYNNTVETKIGPLVYAAGQGQHSDGIQPMGKYFKIYNNLFLNPGNACIELEGGDSSSGYARIWNNVCASVDPGQVGYHRGIEIQWNSNVTAVTDVLIDSNTFVDLNNFYAIAGGTANTSATISGMEIRNNIFYNSGKAGAFEVIRLGSANYTCGTDLIIDHNLINAGTGGGTAVTCDM